MRKQNLYFNAGATALGVVFFGISAVSTTPQTLVQNAHDALAAVGVSVGVAPNQYNTLAQQLSTKEAVLTAREAAISAKEAAVTQTAVTADNKLGFYSLCISVVLFLLVAINFYLDMRRRSKVLPAKKFSVDLR